MRSQNKSSICILAAHVPCTCEFTEGGVCLPHWTVAGCESKERQMFARHKDLCRRV